MYGGSLYDLAAEEGLETRILGEHEAVIIDGRVPHSILLELFSNRGSGTRFYRRSHRE